MSAASFRKYRRFWMFVIGILVGLAIAYRQRTLTMMQPKNESQMKWYPAVIVLGEKLINGTQPSANLQSRIQTAVEVVRQQQQMYGSSGAGRRDGNNRIHVIFSGGDTASVNKAEAIVMKEIWEEMYDLDDDHKLDKGQISIELENQSLSTCQNAFYSIPILQRISQKHLHQEMNLIIVTSDYHVARTRLLFEQVFSTELQDNKGAILQNNEMIAAPTNDPQLRTQLFTNERHWLKPESLEKLLHQMIDHPFDLPTNERIQQAEDELDQME